MQLPNSYAITKDGQLLRVENMVVNDSQFPDNSPGMKKRSLFLRSQSTKKRAFS